MKIKDLIEFSRELEDFVDYAYNVVEEVRFLLEEVHRSDDFDRGYVLKQIEKLKKLEDKLEKC